APWLARRASGRTSAAAPARGARPPRVPANPARGSRAPTLRAHIRPAWRRAEGVLDARRSERRAGTFSARPGRTVPVVHGAARRYPYRPLDCLGSTSRDAAIRLDD